MSLLWSRRRVYSALFRDEHSPAEPFACSTASAYACSILVPAPGLVNEPDRNVSVRPLVTQADKSLGSRASATDLLTPSDVDATVCELVDNFVCEASPVIDMTTMTQQGFKKLLLCVDPASGLHAVIAIHSTTLGPATGGVRMWPYPTTDAAVTDAMRLARGMTYKYASAGINLGGGKAVINADPRTMKTEALLRAFGRFVDQLGGEYITGEDVGMTLADMETIAVETNHVVTLPSHAGGAGDISEATSTGAVLAMKACAYRVWGVAGLAGKSVALQGLGACGSKALKMLLDEGAVVTVTDVDADRVEVATKAHPSLTVVAPEDIYGVDVDIFAPFALGGVMNDDTIGQLKAKVVAGSANNIFAEPRHAEALDRLDITYAVDYIANSGGTIFDTDRYQRGGFQSERAWASVERIYDRILQTFTVAEQQDITCREAADRLAEKRLDELARLRLLDTPSRRKRR